MSKTPRTPYKKNNVKETCERCGKKKRNKCQMLSQQTVWITVRANSSVLSRLLNVSSDGDDVTVAGKLFHTHHCMCVRFAEFKLQYYSRI